VNMSQYFEDYGKVFIEDEIRENLPPDLKKQYDSENLSIHIAKKGEREGGYLPGVYIKDLERSQYVFQFYHLHPLWMSIFGKLFGDTNRVYSLVFFSLLSIAAFYLLAFEFTNSKRISFGAGFLLAVNPLHAFFSKFPVTEVVALAFTLLSFVYLLKYRNLTKKNIYVPIYLVFSALLLFGMFLTRISGFMYLPFFYLLLILLPFMVNDMTVNRHLKSFVLSVFVFYGISVWYGLTFSYPYSSDVYRLSFELVFGEHWLKVILVMISSLVPIYFVIERLANSQYKTKIKATLLKLRICIPYLFVLVSLIGLYKVYQLGFTDKFIDDHWYSTIWKADGTRMGALTYWSDFVLVEYLSPFLALLFAIVVFVYRKDNDGNRLMLLLFILFFFTNTSVLQWFVPYQYYYARYLLTETMPAILLFTCIGIDRVTNNKIYISLVAAAGVYMLSITATQYQGKEMGGLHDSLSEIGEHVGKDDILMVDKRWLYSAASVEIKTSLKYYYDLNVLTISDTSRARYEKYFCNQNKNIFFFGLPDVSEKEKLIKTLEISADYYERVNSIPSQVNHSSKKHHLSKLDCT
jgi:hypothetical protein